MAKVGYMILCEDVFDNKSGGVTIDKPFTQVTPFSIPGQFSFTLAFSVFDLEVDKNYKLDIEFHAPSGKKFWNMDAHFNFKDSPKQGLEELNSTLINIPFKNILIEENGIHKFVVNINDGEDIKTLEIPIREYKGDKNER